MKAKCPKKDEVKDQPAANLHHIPDVQGKPQSEGKKRKLLKTWGTLNNQKALILFDPGSTDNFLSLDMMERLRITPDKLGSPIGTGSAFEGLTTNSTPIQGKFNLRLGEFRNQESILRAPISGCDVILGMP